MTLPASWSALLEPFRRGTFTLFTVLATGLVLQAGRRSVVGMLAGAGVASKVSFHAACRFFSSSAWDIDALCLIAARLIVTRLLDDDASIVVAIDDTLFKRWGRKVHHAFWTHDGSAQGDRKIARGNRWIISGIVVRLPFVTAPLCLPVLFRLWAGKGTTTPVELAGELLKLLAAEFPGRAVHGVGDAAYHGKPLVVKGTTWTTRLPANAVLYDLAPPPTGRRGRPALKGASLRRPADLAAAAAWQQAGVLRYGRADTIQVAIVDCIWHGSFGNAEGRCVLVRNEDSAKAYDLALFTLDPAASTARLVDQPFAYDDFPLVGWDLIHRPGGTVLLQREHHLVHDGWSVGVFLSQLSDAYRAIEKGEQWQCPQPAVSRRTGVRSIWLPGRRGLLSLPGSGPPW